MVVEKCGVLRLDAETAMSAETDPNQTFSIFREILISSKSEHCLHQHKPVLSYDDARDVAEELGLTGTEGKVVVCRAGEVFAVYITTEGKRFDASELKRLLQARRLRIASADELRANFGAEPGSAYPFGFADEVPIVVDPDIYATESLLFSTPLPTVTLEISGEALRRILAGLPNPLHEAASA